MSAEVLVGILFLALVALITVAYILVRILPVNRARRGRGLFPLKWREIAGSRMRRDALSKSDAQQTLSKEKDLRRQFAWEAEQASHELMKYGSHTTRTHCAMHDRWCVGADDVGHPPGGFNNPRVPDDWPPDLRSAVQKKR